MLHGEGRIVLAGASRSRLGGRFLASRFVPQTRQTRQGSHACGCNQGVERGRQRKRRGNSGIESAKPLAGKAAIRSGEVGTAISTRVRTAGFANDLRTAG